MGWAFGCDGTLLGTYPPGLLNSLLFFAEGHDALIVSSEDERYVVVAGTFEKLVEQLACEEKPDPRFVMTFLLGYRHFSTASELLTILLRRYPFLHYVYNVLDIYNVPSCHLAKCGWGLGGAWTSL